MIPYDVAIGLAVLLGVFFSVIIHELAHAAAALWFGDDTAKRLGRLTLDPLVHIDPIMSVIVPLVLYVSSNGLFTFGAAKPVPIDPRRLRNPRHDMMWIALAGPVSNVLIAAALVLTINVMPSLDAMDANLARGVWSILERLILINLFLAAFNLMPVPPLDGSKVLAAYLPDRVADSYLSIGDRQGILLVMLLCLTGVTRVLVGPVTAVAEWLIRHLVFI